MAPKLLAMMIKHGLAGDDALLRLAQARFQEADLGAELYPETPEQFGQQLPFRPQDRPLTVHLPRNINLLQSDGRERVMAFARPAAGNVLGMIVHDHPQFEQLPEDTIRALRDMDRRLAALSPPPLLFVEYAAGLPLDAFATLFERSRDLRYVTACIDISHVGIQMCRVIYGAVHPGVDICALKSAPDLAARLDGIQVAVVEALPHVVGLVTRLGRLGKPLHFHLHDGHPLSTLSRYGVSDHLSFLQEIHLPCVHRGRQLLPGMFGPVGLRAIVQAALAGPAAERLSFMVEVHPQEGRTPLGVHASLFAHWKDRTNAERMNYWLDQLLLNARLVREVGA